MKAIQKLDLLKKKLKLESYLKPKINIHLKQGSAKNATDQL